MDISASTVAQSSSPRSNDQASKKSEASDYETFLKMLTAQMRNQDPLNPVESSDFAAQLAAFSSVEQQALTNDLLTSIQTGLAQSDFSSMANWVGMEVRGPNAAYFDQEAISVALGPQQGDRSEFFVRNETGAEVFRMVVPEDRDHLVWDGMTKTGAIAPAGLYSFHAEGFASGESLGSRQLEPYGLIKEAKTEDGRLRLVLSGGVEITPDEVSALRSPV